MLVIRGQKFIVRVYDDREEYAEEAEDNAIRERYQNQAKRVDKTPPSGNR